MYSSGGGLDTFSPGTFWGRGSSLFGAGSPLDDILEKDSSTLEDVLDEETVLQEAKAMNEKLVDFLKEPQIIAQLLNYVACSDMETFKALSMPQENGPLPSSSEPTSAAASLVVNEEEEGETARLEAEELQEERLLKFPYVSCEIICCNLTPIIEPIVSNADLLAKFFSILNRSSPIDSRLSGYFFKILAVLLRRAPDKILWFSVYRNTDISEAGCEDGIQGIGWLMPKLLEHIDSYSIMCCFKSLLQVAADENILADGEDEDEDGDSFPGYGTSMLGRLNEQVGDLDDREDCDDEQRNALMSDARWIWLGGHGAALAILDALAASNNSDSHNNAAELLADMIQRAAMARLALQDGSINSEEIKASEESTDALPLFSGFVLKTSGRGSGSETAVIESGVDWTLKLCRELLSVALFQSSSQSQQNQTTQELDDGDWLLSIVERGSAAVASLQVLTHLVHAFALERWSEPSEQFKAMQGLVHVTSMERHGDIPPEIDVIVNALPNLASCLHTAKHAERFGITEERAKKYLGLHRLKVVELICMLVHTKYPRAIEAVASSTENPLNVCLDLFFQHEWNNCLHSVVERTMQFSLLGGVSEESIGMDEGSIGSGNDEEGDISSFFDRRQLGVPSESDAVQNGDQSSGNQSERMQERIHVRQIEIAREQKIANTALWPLQKVIFEECSLISRLLRAYEENKACLEDTAKFWSRLDRHEAPEVRGNLRSCGQKGYMGFCHRIVNTIALVAETQRNESRDEGTNSEDEERWSILWAADLNPKWKEFLETEMTEVNRVEQLILGGERPQTMSEQGSEGLGGGMEDFGASLGGPVFEEQDLDAVEFVEREGPGNVEQEFNPFGLDTSKENQDEFDALAAESADSMDIDSVPPPQPPSELSKSISDDLGDEGAALAAAMEVAMNVNATADDDDDHGEMAVTEDEKDSEWVADFSGS